MFKSLDVPKIVKYIRLLSDKRDSDFATDEEITSLAEDQFNLLFMKLVETKAGYYMKESTQLQPINGQILFPDDLYKLKVVQRQDGFNHAVREINIEEASLLDSVYFDTTLSIPTAYGYVLFSDHIKLYPLESTKGMNFKLTYARDPLSIENEKMQKGWENFIKYKTAYIIGVIEENPRQALGDLALEWQQNIEKYSSERNQGLKVISDLESAYNNVY